MPEIDLIFAVPFDFPMFVELDLLGTRHRVALESSDAILELPRVKESGDQKEGQLFPPDSAVERLTSHVDTWGSIYPTGHGLTAQVEEVLFVVPRRADLDFDISSDQLGGDDLDELRVEIHSWLDSFVAWVWILTSQSLDPNHPDPKFFHRRSTNIITVGVMGNASSYAASGSPPLVIVTGSDGQCSERVVDERVFALCAERAGVASPPLTMELLASARMACRRGDRRRALIDVGTAAEAALTSLLGLDQTHGYTLGGLVRLASQSNLSIPADTDSHLVKPRNDAVHRGLVPSPSTLTLALEITEQLVAQVEPDAIPVSSLRATQRPQRHDIVIIQGPKRQE
jgi:hypothetical protein